MKKRALFSIVIVLVLVLTATTVFADADDGYADSVQSYDQGTNKNGTPVLAARSDPTNALGAPLWSINPVLFFSLGFGGEITLGFDEYICNTETANIEITTYEVTNGSYPTETADVYVGSDPLSLVYAGTVDNKGNDVVYIPDSVFEVKYIKLVDTSIITPFEATADGFDLDAVAVEGYSTTPCSITVDVDIKPGSDPSCFNNDGNGIIPIAINGSTDFDVYTINAGTVTMSGLSVAVKGKSDKLMAAYEDWNGDGYTDLMLKIVDGDNTFEQGSGTATIEGYLLDGTPIIGTGDICITQ